MFHCPGLSLLSAVAFLLPCRTTFFPHTCMIDVIFATLPGSFALASLLSKRRTGEGIAIILPTLPMRDAESIGMMWTLAVFDITARRLI